MIRWVFWFLAASGSANACEATGQRMASDVGDAPSVYVAIDDVPLGQPFSMIITVCDETEVSEMRVHAIMPAHQHGLNYVPVVTALGDGKFEVDGVLFHMPGLWELQVHVIFGGQSAHYTSEVVLK